jgi:alpha-tubulin suppressor-like RCC1 family protein
MHRKNVAFRRAASALLPRGVTLDAWLRPKGETTVKRTMLSILCAFASLFLTSCDHFAVTIVSPSNGATVRTTSGVVVRLFTTGNNGAVSFSCQLDGGLVTPCTTAATVGNERQVRITRVTEGLHQFTIRGVDAAGATASASVSFLADLPLQVAIAAPRDLERVTSDAPEAMFSPLNATGRVAFTCSVDDEPAAACTSPQVLANLPDGPHRLTVTATDATDSAFATVPFSKDTGAWPTPTAVREVSAGGTHTCALLVDGRVRCWGDNSFNQLGYQNRLPVGDDEFPSGAGDVNVGGPVTQIAAGESHTCALLDTRAVRCWGFAGAAALGYGRSPELNEPAAYGDVTVGGDVTQIDVGLRHSCAVLATGKVRCWGENESGELGYAGRLPVGDDEVPASAGDVEVGGSVRQISLGAAHTCALLESGTVRCWGSNSRGQLGYPHTWNVGDDEAPTSAGDVQVGAPVVQVTAGDAHTCALLAGGTVRCWGFAGSGRLGYTNPQNIGDDEHPAVAGDVAVGGTVVEISAGAEHTCARLQGGAVRCWGSGVTAALGYGNRTSIGDDELPSSAGDVDVGGVVSRISAGSRHTCALLTTGFVRCWGALAFNAMGLPAPSPVLGYPRRDPVGDNEPPSSAGDVFVGF